MKYVIEVDKEGTIKEKFDPAGHTEDEIASHFLSLYLNSSSLLSAMVAFLRDVSDNVSIEDAIIEAEEE